MHDRTRPPSTTRLSGWGRFPVVQGRERLSEDLERATRDAALTRGLGRSYGDASLPPNGTRAVAGSRLADRILAFDESTGQLRAEAGFSLGQLSRVFLPRGFSSPVHPGTQFVTLGGMVAADVHGKNHHVAGCIGEHVTDLRVRVADGRVLDISPDREGELFRATLGGMGLTGHILEVGLRLERIPSPWILEESEPVAGLDALLARLRESSGRWPFTVSWYDAMSHGPGGGRGILICGRWATPEEASRGGSRPGVGLTVPFEAPRWLLNDTFVRVFNRLYHLKHPRRVRQRIVHPTTFFHPLDVVHDWNRVYGRRGFTQYQCVLPEPGDRAACDRLFEVLRREGGVSYLTVIKDCGKQGSGTLSFPRPGISVALDIPVRGERTQRVIDALNALTLEVGGRIYLAKDALTRADHFRAMEGERLDVFEGVRRRWDARSKLSSALSVRLFGDPA